MLLKVNQSLDNYNRKYQIKATLDWRALTLNGSIEDREQQGVIYCNFQFQGKGPKGSYVGTISFVSRCNITDVVPIIMSLWVHSTVK